MKPRMPFIEVTGPDDQSFTVQVTTDRLTVGRFAEYNDIALEPDPQQLVTRLGHCNIEREGGAWWVIDNGSVNKTFIQWEGQIKVVEGKEYLGDGASILILGRLMDDGEPVYWKLDFHDPMGTQPADAASRVAFLEYDWIQAKLFRFDGQIKEEIQGLRPQEHKLIRFMDQRNRANGYVAVMCGYEELISAVWGDEAFGHSEADINRLAWELRKKVEINPKEPQFLQTVKGLGYRLITQG